MREGANINKSLLALGNCINALAANKVGRGREGERGEGGGGKEGGRRLVMSIVFFILGQVLSRPIS